MDATCLQGGVDRVGGLSVQPLPPSRQGLKVTDKVRFDISVGGENSGALTLGLWRDAAPESVDAFVRLSRGTFVSEAGEEPASYDGAMVDRVERDLSVTFGKLKKTGGTTRLVAGVTRPQRVPVAPPATSDALNGVSNDAAGLLSVRRGGGSFEFCLATRADAAEQLDSTQIVIGQVLEGMELLERINTLPTNNYDRGPLANVKIARVAVE